MELLKIRSGNKEAFERKQYNIGVGISLGNKWFTPENIVEQIQWVLPYTKESVTVFIADTIHGINLEVKKGLSKERAAETAKEMGRILLAKVRELIQLKGIDESKIKYITWEDITNNDSYKQKVSYLYKLYESDVSFREKIHTIVSYFIVKDSMKYTPEQIHYLGTYILEEMPELINGANLNAYAYPHDGEVGRLVEKIQMGSIFPDIKHNIMYGEPKAFLEIR